jgi:hypothetical protein
VSASAPLPRAEHHPYKLSQRLSEETVTAILAAYQAGATIRAVGERFDLAHSSINKLLRRYGVEVRRRGPQRFSRRHDREPSSVAKPDSPA